MTTAEIRTGAIDYVNKQLATMEQYGSAPRLSPAEYDGLVEDVIETTLAIRLRYGLATED